MSTASVILAIENLAQSVAALLGNLGAFNATYGNTLISTIELIKTQVASLPIQAGQKTQIINLLNLAENIITSAITAGSITTTQVNSLLDILQLEVLKTLTFSLLT